jgi:transcriptional regulator with XRE-family HTH domain
MNKPFPKVGQALRKLRQQANVSQQHVASACKFTNPQYISNIERGLAAVPPKHLKKIANALGYNQKEFAHIMFHAYLEDEEARWQKESKIKF